MRAAVLCEAGRIELRDVPCPAPGPREVLVRVTGVGLCGTDFHIFALAERFGAETIDPAARDPAEVVPERTQGRGAELLIEATGSGLAFAAIPGLVRKQATVLLYGHGHAGVDLSVLSQLQFLEPTLLAPVGASGGFERDGRPSTYVRALQLIERGQVDVASLITHRYPSLDSVPRAFGGGDHGAADYVKGVVTCASRCS